MVRIKGWRILLAIIFVTLSGCLSKDQMTRHPDAAFLITDVGLGKVRASVYDTETKELVDFGWISNRHLVGWTASKFDWDNETK